MGALRLILGLLLAVAVVSFGVMNMEPVSMTYHRIGTYKVPLFYVLIAFFASGFVVAWVGGLFDRLRFYARLMGYRREVRSLKRDLEEARQKSDHLLPPPAAGANGEAPGLSRPSGAAGSSPSGTQNREGGNVSVN